jgi:hypothetical protein
VPSMTMQPLANAMRSFGNHETIAFQPRHKGGGEPNTDQKPRQDEGQRPSAMANSAAPAAATTRSGFAADHNDRAPTPTGT